jgi:uncharacterized protein (TIGR02266 family)
MIYSIEQTNQKQKIEMLPNNRRKFARIMLDSMVKVVFRGAEQRDQVLLQNISEGGLFFATEQLKPIGTKLHFEFRVQDGGETIAGYGIVRWVETDLDKRKGMGIQFIEINDAGQQILSKLFRKKGFQEP